MSRKLSPHVERKLIAESMGRCMNPSCKKELFGMGGDIMERAHIVPFCSTANNTFENLIILCPNCHTNFDKNTTFTEDEVKMWKQIRNDEFMSFFAVKYSTFDELKCKVVPLLTYNKTIFENYFLNENKVLWNKFEAQILINNKELKTILESNLHLIQSHEQENYSNLALIHKFFLHIDEFEQTRLDNEKNRQVLFPEEINSLFGIAPVNQSFIQSVESLEALIEKLSREDRFKCISLGNENPYLEMFNGSECVRLFLNDVPNLRQVYFENKCFRQTIVRLQNLNFILRHIKSKGLRFSFATSYNLREVILKGKHIVFVYEYCLSRDFLERFLPPDNSIVVNLYNWNGEHCISHEARDFSHSINVTLMTSEEFYVYIRKIQQKH